MLVTKNHLTALKKADYAIFERYTNQEGEIVNQLRVGNRYDYDQPWKNWEVQIPVAGGSKFDLYSHGTPYKFDYGYTPRACCCHVSLYWDNIGRHDPIYTVLKSLRAGDKLTFLWRFSPGNGYLEGAISNTDACTNARLYKYDLILIVTRGKSEHSYHIDTQVGPQNSASMIKL